jgi:hypothetical protein
MVYPLSFEGPSISAVAGYTPFNGSASGIEDRLERQRVKGKSGAVQHRFTLHIAWQNG